MPETDPVEISFAVALAAARDDLSAHTEAGRDAEILLGHAAGISRSQLLAYPERLLTLEQYGVFRNMLGRRRNGEPVAYLIGCREFWSLPLKVTPATLVPRAETESLVEQALIRLPPGDELEVLDLGTGCGAIALAIARERSHCRVTGSDVSEDALRVARENQDRLALQNIDWAQGSWYQAVARRNFDLIVSNPPYVPDGDPHLGQGDLPHEPALALASGKDGLDAIREIIEGAASHLKRPGWLLLEHGFDQQSSVLELLIAAGFDKVCGHQDLAGLPRVAAGHLHKKDQGPDL
ncbi:MAG: peptide chain release factor N(5)-glutamine methyltransferase [Proteobacteria bacterium]|nr:peptide chain release factor N(5)-glutamine methyltransferase [Pseudomonadota bacterium]